MIKLLMDGIGNGGRPEMRRVMMESVICDDDGAGVSDGDGDGDDDGDGVGDCVGDGVGTNIGDSG